MTYTIGQQVAFDKARALMGDKLAGLTGQGGRWYVLKTAQQREFEVCKWLEDEDGVLDAWLPTVKAYRKIPRGTRRKVAYKRKIAPGYVFVCVTRCIVWDVLYARANGKVIGVVGRDGRPLPVPEAQMRQMKMLPETIQKQYAQEQEARHVRPGDKARIMDGTGVMSDWIVDVVSVNGGIAKVFLPLFGGHEAEVPMEHLERSETAAKPFHAEGL
jgi:transcription antitermination factor NusG